VYFIKHKKYTQNPNPQKVTAVLRPLQARIRGQLLVYRADSKQEVLNRRLSLSPIFNNSIYNSHRKLCLLLLLLLITAEDPPTMSTTTTAVTEVVFAFRAKIFEKYYYESC
jgi:hypothetical protein